MLDSYFNPDFSNIRIIEEDTKYLSSLNKNITEKIILLRAQLGGGKTTAIKKFIKENYYKRILFVSPRITFSQFISTEFETEFYLDENVKINADKLTISVESLHRIEFNTIYDVVILDECEANLSVFSSATIKQNQVKCFEILNKFINQSKKTILATAFVTKKTIDFMNSFNIPAVSIHNKTEPNLKIATRFHQDILTIKLIESVKRGKKNYVVFSSKNTMNGIIDILRGLGFFETKNILIYSSDSDDSLINTLKNIEESWGKANLVMTTPTITVGNSYKPKLADFDNIFCFGAPTCCVCDTFQGMKRVRETKNNVLYYSLPDKASLATNKRFAQYKFDILKNYNTMNCNKNNQLKKIIARIIKQLSKG